MSAVSHNDGCACRIPNCLNLVNPQIVHHEAIGPELTFFVAYAQTKVRVDLDEIDAGGPTGPYARSCQPETFAMAEAKRRH